MVSRIWPSTVVHDQLADGLELGGLERQAARERGMLPRVRIAMIAHVPITAAVTGAGPMWKDGRADERRDHHGAGAPRVQHHAGPGEQKAQRGREQGHGALRG